MSDKPKFHRLAALEVARFINEVLGPRCERIIFAGSLRRRKKEVGDIEVLYIPKFHTRQDGLFETDTTEINEVDALLENWLAAGVIFKRPNSNGAEPWGAKNKFAVHALSGIPIDFFTANKQNWYNYLVCRTGSSETNTRIASAAKAKGWQWHPYRSGFTDQEGNFVPVYSEQDVFRNAGLPYLEPWER